MKDDKPLRKTRHSNLESLLQKDLPTVFLLLFHYNWHLGRQWESSNVNSCESGVPLLSSGQALKKNPCSKPRGCIWGMYKRSEKNIMWNSNNIFFKFSFLHWSKKLVILKQTGVVWYHKMCGFWEDLKLSWCNYSPFDFKELSRLYQPICLVKSLHML